MLEPLYIAGNSRLHRLPAGLKLLARARRGGLFALRDPRWLGLALAVAAGLVWSSGAGARCSGANCAAWRGFCWRWDCSPAFSRWVEALAVLLRVGAMVGLALAVTLTTRTADLIAVCEWALLPCSAWACSMPARWRWPWRWRCASFPRSGAISMRSARRRARRLCDRAADRPDAEAGAGSLRSHRRAQSLNATPLTALSSSGKNHPGKSSLGRGMP